MAANKRKILESARKLAQKGAKEKALAEYQKLLKLDPKDAKLRLEIGDAHRRWGQVDEAVDTYTRVAEQYMTEGFDARAVAVFKQILSLDAERLAAYTPLAELYERMGLTAEAIAALQTAADGYYKSGEREEALELLRRMANVDPANTMSRIKVADLLRQEGRNEDAVSEYSLAAEELERQGDVESVGNVYRRILELDESNVAAMGSLARNLSERGKLAEAVPLAERALQLDAGTVERYEVLAGLYDRLERPNERGEVYRKLADLYRQRGDEDQARSILQRFVPAQELSADGGDALGDDEFLDGEDALFDQEFPEDQGLEPSLDFGNEDSIGNDAGSQQQPALMDDLASDLDDPLLDEPLLEDDAPATSGPDLDDAGPEIVLDEPAPEPTPEPEAAPAEVEIDLDDEIVLDEPVVQPQIVKPAAASAPAASAAPEFDVEQLLAEASVYLRYGKSDKAIDHLEQVIATDPDHRSALEKLGEAFAESGQNDRAVEVWLRAAKRADEDEDADAVRVLRGRIAALDESAAASLDPAPPAADPSAPLTPDAGAPGDDGFEDPASIEIDLSIDDEDLAGEDDPVSLPDDEALADLDVEIPDGGGQEDGPFEDAQGMSLSMAEAAVQDSFDGNSLSTSTTQQVLEDLEEADFYVQQGLFDEAEAIYQRVLSVAPNHPRALVRLGEVMAAKGGSPTALGGATPAAEPAAEAAPEITLDDAVGADDAGSSGEVTRSAIPRDEDALQVADEESLADSADLSDLDAAADDAALADEVALDDEVGLVDDVAVETGDDATGEITADPSDTQEIQAPKTALADAAAEATPASVVEENASEDVAERAAASEAPEEESAEEPAGATIEDVAEEVAAVAAEVEPDPAPPVEAGDFDLAAALSDAFDDEDDATSAGSIGGSDDDGFAAVFSAFKKGVSETLTDGDHQAHYDLAIAYKEMGLYDDAIHELRAAMADPGRTAECLHLIGLCAIDGDQAPLAVEHLEQLLTLDGLHPEQALAGRLDLGRSLQMLGELDGARAAWQAVAEERPGFQDVESLLAGLDDPDSAPDADAGEDFESFDDVMDAVLEEDDGTAVAEGETFDDLVAEANEVEAEAVVIEDEASDDEAAPDAAESVRDVPDAPASPATKARRKKKKISFV
ncbi:MAG: tetratricopeptide repeat protein [Myxococcota bacterium]